MSGFFLPSPVENRRRAQLHSTVKVVPMMFVSIPSFLVYLLQSFRLYSLEDMDALFRLRAKVIEDAVDKTQDESLLLLIEFQYVLFYLFIISSIS